MTWKTSSRYHQTLHATRSGVVKRTSGYISNSRPRYRSNSIRRVYKAPKSTENGDAIISILRALNKISLSGTSSSSTDRSSTSSDSELDRILRGFIRKLQKSLESGSKESETTASKVYKDYLYVGPWRAAINEEYLHDQGITDVMSVGWPINPRDRVRGIEYHDIPALLNLPDDGKETTSILKKKIIKKSGSIIKEVAQSGDRKILVHCHKGWSRSASIVMAYLIKYRKKKYWEAFAIVQKNRPVIDPKDNFLAQLWTLHCKVHKVPEDSLSILYEFLTKGKRT